MASLANPIAVEAAARRAATDVTASDPLMSRRLTAARARQRGRGVGQGLGQGLGRGVLLLVLGGFGLMGARAEDGPATAPAAAPAVEAKSRTSRPSRSKADRADEPRGADEAREAREQRVLAFVREHNPELAAVLAHLARRQPEDYDTALDDLDRTVSKLAGTSSKDPELHAIELAVWQTRTRVEMLVAQLMAGATKSRTSLEARLREALAAELEAKAAHLGYRRQRSMAWYDRQIDRIRADRDEMVETRMKALLKQEAARLEEQAAGRQEPATGR